MPDNKFKTQKLFYKTEITITFRCICKLIMEKDFFLCLSKTDHSFYNFCPGKTNWRLRELYYLLEYTGLEWNNPCIGLSSINIIIFPSLYIPRFVGYAYVKYIPTVINSTCISIANSSLTKRVCERERKAMLI